MLSARGEWVEMVEVNPPRLPSMTHSRLRGRWRRVLITDNPFKQVRVSPYAFAARITHDVPDVRPTVVCSTRDRNILAIESEVRGAIGNGVDSFLVVQGDMLPEVEHWSNSYEIVEHLRALQEQIGPGRFEVGMSTRSRQLGVPAPDRGRRPVLHDRAGHGSGDGAGERGSAGAGRAPPVYLELTPPFSRVGGAARGVAARRSARRSASAWRPPPRPNSDLGWRAAKAMAVEAREAGFAGVVLMGLRFETAVGEAYDMWHDDRVTPLFPGSEA